MRRKALAHVGKTRYNQQIKGVPALEYSRLELSEGVALYLAAVAARAERHDLGHRLCETVTGRPLQFEESGRPYLSEGPQVSISHSGALVVCAVGENALGADIERAHSAAPRTLERAKAAGYDETTEFLHWWTAREANCKRLGRGFTWSPLPPPAHCVQGTLEHQGETYYYSVCW